MPRTIDEGFRDFHTRLTPTTGESEAAKSHRQSIETRLKASFGLLRFFRIGSSGNATSISGFSDVDYLAWLARDTLAPNSAYSLTKVRDDLALRFPATGVRVDSPAIALPFGYLDSETTEVVPARYGAEVNGITVFEIADGNGGWMRACPELHRAYVNIACDKFSGNKVKQLIRFVKAWKYYNSVPISSFYLELRVAQYASTQSEIIFHCDLSLFFSQLVADGLASIQDPMGISGSIHACKTPLLKLDALSKVKTAASRAQRAWDEIRKGNVDRAFDAYSLLYDEQFPSYYR